MLKTAMLSWLISLLCAFFAILVGVPAHAEKVTLRFTPQNGLTFIENDTSNSTQTSTDEKKSLTQQVSTRRRITIHKTAAGYSIDFTTISMTTSRNGGKPHTASKADLQSATLTYMLDAKGKLIDVQGLDAAVAARMSKVPPAQQKEFPVARYKAYLQMQQLEEWQSEVGKFIGLTLTIGKTETKDEAATKDSPVSAHMTRQCTGYVMVNGRNCLRLLDIKRPNPRELATSLNDRFNSHNNQSGKVPPSQVLSASSLLTEERLIDPTTCLSLSLKTTQSDTVVAMKSKAGDAHPHKVTVTMNETETSTFEFTK